MPPTNYLENKVRSAVKWHGGKAHLARRILDLITGHEIYLEGFAGGANLLLNKYRAPREILCDLDAELIHFYQYLVANTAIFIDRIREIPYARESFQRARGSLPGLLDPLERAVRFFVIQNMSRGGMGRDFSDFATDPRQRNLPAWLSYLDDLPVTADRLREVEIRLQSAFDAIDEFAQDPRVLGYFDPPYYPSTRVSSRVYTHELTAFEHLKFLRKIQEFQGRVIISGYANPTYDRELAGWDREVIPIRNASSQQKQKPLMEEILWVKPYWPF